MWQLTHFKLCVACTVFLLPIICPKVLAICILPKCHWVSVSSYTWQLLNQCQLSCNEHQVVCKSLIPSHPPHIVK